MQYHSLKQSASSNRVRQLLKLLNSKNIQYWYVVINWPRIWFRSSSLTIS